MKCYLPSRWKRRVNDRFLCERFATDTEIVNENIKTYSARIVYVVRTLTISWNGDVCVRVPRLYVYRLFSLHVSQCECRERESKFLHQTTTFQLD